MQIDMGLDKPSEFVPESHAWRTRALNALLAVASGLHKLAWT